MLSRTLIINVILALFLCIGTSYSQLFIKSYDFPPPPYVTSEKGRSIQPVSPIINGDWTIVGNTFAIGSNDTNQGSWFIKKVNSAGTVIAQRRLTTLLPSGNQMRAVRHDSCLSHIRLDLQGPRFVIVGGYARPSFRFPLDLRRKASWTMMNLNLGHMQTRMIADTLEHLYRSIAKDKNENFVNAGSIETYYSPKTEPTKILLSKYTSMGGFAWANRYIPPFNGIRYSNETAYSVCYQPVDNTYGVTGTTDYYTGNGGKDIFIMKVSQAGAPIWFKVYRQSIPSNTQITESRGIVALPDGGFGVTGWTNVSDPNFSDIVIMSVNSNGNITWFMEQGFTNKVEQGQALIFNPTDSFFTITGNMTQFQSFQPNAYWIRIQWLTGAIMWNNYYNNPPGFDVGYDIEEAPGTVPGYAITGQVLGTNALDVLFARTDSKGEIIEQCPVRKNFDEPAFNLVEDSLILNSLGLIDSALTPYIDSVNVATTVLCTSGTIPTQDVFSDKNQYTLAQNYPNPFNPVTIINYNLPEQQYVTIKIYNILGEVVKVLADNEFNSAGVHTVQFDGSSFASGIYFYEIRTGTFTDRKKMLLIK